jgi:hypothetical protein
MLAALINEHVVSAFPIGFHAFVLLPICSSYHNVGLRGQFATDFDLSQGAREVCILHIFGPSRQVSA